MAAITGSRTLSCVSNTGDGLRPATYRLKACANRDLPLGPRIETITWSLPPARSERSTLPLDQRKARSGVSMRRCKPQRLITFKARTLYVVEEGTVGPDQYRILAPWTRATIVVPVGLSVGALPHQFGGGEDAPLARPAGQHSEFYPHPRMASCTTFMPSICSCRPRAIYVVDRGYVDFARLYVLHRSRAFFVTRRQVEHRCSSRLFGADGSLMDRHPFATRPISPGRLQTARGRPITPNFCGASWLQGPRVRSRRWSSGCTKTSRFRRGVICALYKSRWQVERFFKWIKQHLRIKPEPQPTSENWSRRRSGHLGLRPRRHRQEGSPRPSPRSTLCEDPLGDLLRENAQNQALARRRQQDAGRFASNQPIEFIRLFNRTLVFSNSR